MSVSPTSPALSSVDERFVVVADPRPGTTVEVAPGTQVKMRFRRGVGPSRWHLTQLPSHLLALRDTGFEFQFLVFGCPTGPVPLRLERRHPEREIAHQVCEVLVVPVSDESARTSTSASPRSA